MAVFVRAKRVTDPLGEKVKALIHGGSCSGSGSGAGNDGVARGDFDCFVSSESEHEVGSALSGDVHGFFFDMDDDIGDGNIGGDYPDDHEEGEGDVIRSGGASSSSSSSFMVRERAMVDLIRKMSADSLSRKGLLRAVSETAARFEPLRISTSSSAFRRAVMTSLRDDYNYNAGICKTRWERDGKVNSGSYEYIDVTISSNSRRYIVDMDFAGEFEIARPTEEYAKLVLELPVLYVGTAEEVRKIVRVIADAAKRSMGIKKMHVPPWRRAGYMHNKWLGSYKRTINPVNSSKPPTSDIVGLPTVQCHGIGFPPARILAVPSACNCK